MIKDALKVVTDGWENVLSGLGTSRDARTRAAFSRRRVITHNSSLLDSLYDQDPIFGRIVDLPAKEIYREWITVRAQTDGDDLSNNVAQELARLEAKEIFVEAEIFGRLYGGALILMGIDDGSDPTEPLDIENIKSIDWLQVVDRWDVTTSSRYKNAEDKKFGMPEVYAINFSVAGEAGHERIHESRTLRFEGRSVSRRRRLELDGWTNSVLERPFDLVRDFQSATGGIMTTLQEFSIGVFKIKGLAEMLASDHDGLVLKRLRLLDQSKSVARSIPLDADTEEFSREGQKVSGMGELYDQMMMQVAMAAEMPVSLLFGRGAQGMNATGELDVRLFYDSIRAAQTGAPTRKLEYLLSIIFAAMHGPTNGNQPESFSVNWNPLFQQDAKEKAETRKITAETDQIYIQNRVLSSRGVAENRFGGDEYSEETTLLKDDETDQELTKKLLLIEASGGNDKKEDSEIGYKNDVKNFCSECSHLDSSGFICDQWLFTIDQGFTCDSFDEAKEEKKDSNPLKIIQGENF